MSPAYPELLYHYTDALALTNIVTNTRLWASDPLYLNDAAELISGRDRLKSRLTLLADLAQHGDLGTLQQLRSSFTRTMVLDALDSLEAIGTFEIDAPHAHVVCFCEQGDLLSQWRSYGQGGYAIGLDPSILNSDCQLVDKPAETTDASSTLAATLVKVAYTDAETDVVIRGASLLGQDEPEWIPSTRPYWKLLEVVASIKDPGFREEQEWRLIHVKTASAHSAPREKFRSGPSSLVPYIELGFPADAIKRVVVGPGGDIRLRVMAVQRLLEAHESGAKVFPSTVPYRG